MRIRGVRRFAHALRCPLYLVAIIFIVFDLEIAFFFPWAVSLRATGTFGLLAMLIFALVLVVALVYDYKRGALEWD